MKLFDSACSSASKGANPNTPTNLSYIPCFADEDIPREAVDDYISAAQKWVAYLEQRASESK